MAHAPGQGSDGGAGESPLRLAAKAGSTARCFRMTLAYDGTAYHGWQIQRVGVTLQSVLEGALQRIIGVPVRTVASGRTDAGVHAWGQVVSFRCHTRLSPQELRRALNANTPDDLEVREVSEAAAGFHAIRCAIAKRYRYVIQEGSQRDLFSRAYSWLVPYSLDVDSMRAGAVHLLGKHDFCSFEAAGAPRKSSVRTVRDLTVRRETCELAQRIAIDIEADGFLYNMVRNIVGSLVLVGRGKQSAQWIQRVLEARDRTVAGPTAPARGLMLMSVQYADTNNAGTSNADTSNEQQPRVGQVGVDTPRDRPLGKRP